MAKIKKRKDGRFEIKLNLGYDPITGKYKRVSVYGNTIQEVKQKALEKQIKGDYKGGKILFIDYAVKFLETKKNMVAPRTFDMYEKKVYNYLKPIHYYNLKDIIKSDLQQIINDNIKHPRTCQQLKNILTAIFESATQDEIIKAFNNVVKLSSKQNNK